MSGVSIQPHAALSSGEMMNQVEVQLHKIDFLDVSKTVIDRTIKVNVLTTATVWEFKNTVSRLLGLSPKYAMFKLSNG